MTQKIINQKEDEPEEKRTTNSYEVGGFVEQIGR